MDYRIGSGKSVPTGTTTDYFVAFSCKSRGIGPSCSDSAHLHNPNEQTSPQLMQTLDRINQRYGRGTLHLASAGTSDTHRQWGMKQERKTSGYTTDWAGLALAR